MVRAREALRSRRLNEKIIQDLQESVHRGIPWVSGSQARGYSDLLYLVRGHLYLPEFIRDNGDLETMTELWWNLRDTILEQHIQREPLTRPWAFYALEDREPRRRLDRKPCRCPLDGRQHPGLPPLSMIWFGHTRGCRCEYEDESEYLDRLGLLTAEEKKVI